MTKALKKQIRFDYAQIGSVKLHYATAGTGDKLVILLHGFPEFWYSWRHQLVALSGEYKVVAPDMRGYNLSDKPKRVSDYAMDKLVDDITGLIRHFGYKKAALVGHDWGAGVCWAVATKNPEYLWKLVCLQVPPVSVWKKNQTVKQLLASWYMFFFQLPKLPEWFLERKDFAKLAIGLKTSTVEKDVFTYEDILEYKKAWGQSGGLTGGINYYRANIIKRLFARSGNSGKVRIKIPTLFIYGEKDHAVLPSTVEGVGDVIDAEYIEVRIPNAGHWVQLEAQQQVTEALINFLTK